MVLPAMFACGAISAQAANRTSVPASVPGELIAWVAGSATATAQDVQSAAAAAGADVVRPLALPGAYLIRVRGTASDVATSEASARLTATGKFRWVGVNRLSYKAAVTPNDTLFAKQWSLPMMRVPDAWEIAKGSSGVIVAVLDTGCDVTHPDLKSRVIGAYNAFDTTKGTDVTDNNGHGTHVAGIACAATNNKVGIAGVTFANVGLYILKASDTGAFPASAVIDAIQHVRTNVVAAGNKVIVNMSIGGAATMPPDPEDPSVAVILNAAREGVLFVTAAGNEGQTGSPASYPAYIASISDMVMSVTAVGPTRKRAAYSTVQPYNTVAGPGGDASVTGVAMPGMVSTLPGGAYGEMEGTSMASPAVAGVAALVLSAGADTADVKSILSRTASAVGTSVPNAEYGYGIVDALNAILEVAVDVTVTEPAGTGGKNSDLGVQPAPVDTLRPRIVVHASHVPPSGLSITIDGTAVAASEWSIENIEQTENNGDGTFSPIVYDAVITGKTLAPGTDKAHIIAVTGVGGVKTTTDSLRFVVQPHEFGPGRALVSIPYYQTTDAGGGALTPGALLQYYLGNGYALNRWLAEQGGYRRSTSSVDTENGFIPQGSLAPHNAAGVAQFPVGLGFWCDTPIAKPILTTGTSDAGNSFAIPLVGIKRSGATTIAWNMVGDPFPFSVPFNSVMFDTTRGRLSAAEAVSAGYIIPHVYSYRPAAGYTFLSLPYGSLNAWEGHWIGVTSAEDITMVVPPVKDTSLRAAAAVASGGWSIRIGAAAGTLRDPNNELGVATGARDTYDTRDAPKPPTVSPYVRLSFQNAAWTTMPGLYARDLRAAGGTKAWPVVVETDRVNTDVTVNWSLPASLPRGLALQLKDNVTGQTVDMRSRSFVTFNSGADAQSRAFTVVARQGANAGLRISNVAVLRSGGRATAAASIGFALSSDASYHVQVMSSAGAPVATVSSRAAAPAGDVRLVWNGRDAAGRAVPTGTYLVQIRATGPDGEVVRAIQPFAVVR